MHLNDAGHDRVARRLAPLLEARLATPPRPLPPPPSNPSLPHDWQTMDIGQDESVGLPGSVSFDSPHTFTLWGSGVDIGGHQDAFRFVYQSLSGNGVIEATVESHSAFSSCAKAGIMIREHLALGAPHVLFGVSPASGIFFKHVHPISMIPGLSRSFEHLHLIVLGLFVMVLVGLHNHHHHHHQVQMIHKQSGKS